MIAGSLFWLLRRLERWLHQHIFKVGWLLTKNFQTTTILYYTFFLPGVFLHEFVYWLMAGVFNVRAERAIRWPEKQEIAELRLNFIKLARNIGGLRLAIITLTPLAAGLAAIWFIANNILQLNRVMGIVQTGALDEWGAALARLTSAPDFWLWIYLLFAIGNTMVPDLKNLRGGRILLIVAVAVALVFVFMGLGDQVIIPLLIGPVASALSVISATFAILIAIDLFFVGVLGTFEAIFERITGDSATFEKGKLVARTRAEILEMRRKQSKAIEKRKERTPAETGPPSFYRFPLPIPGPPGQEPVTPVQTTLLEPAQKPALASGPRDDRAGPDMITGRTLGGSPQASDPLLPASSDEDDEDASG